MYKQAECLRNVPGGPYQNVLFYAAAERPALFNSLVDKVLQINPTLSFDSFGALNENPTPLIVAAQIGAHDSIPKLLDGATARDKNVALSWAVYRGNADTVTSLLKHGALLDDEDPNGYTALHIAVACGKRAIVELLLEKGANVRIRNKQGENALDVAIAKRPEYVDAILMHLATLPMDVQAECLSNVPGGPYQNVLFYAAAKRRALFHSLADKVLQINPTISHQMFGAKNKYNKTALIVAAQIGAHESIPKLLDGATALDKNDALDWAVYRGNADTVTCLLKHGALLDDKDSKGDTALHTAVACGKRAIVELLLEKGANVRIRNKQGENALDVAIAKRPEYVDAILMHLATLPMGKQAECLPIVPFWSFGDLPRPYKDVLIYAAHEKPALFNSLVDKVLQINPTLDSIGDTALHFAVNYGVIAMVELLLEKGVNARTRNSGGKNALDIAIAKHPEYVDAILMNLATLPMDKQAECLRKVPNGPYENVYTYVTLEKPSLLNSLILKASKEPNADTTANLTAILTEMHFDEHIDHIYTHYQQMKKKSLSNSKYIDAVSAAKTLLIECSKAKVALFHSDDATDIKILSFKTTCKSAIETAKPVLEKHRELGKVLAAFLLAIIKLPVSLPSSAARFFSVKTKSNQLLDKLQESIDKPSP